MTYEEKKQFAIDFIKALDINIEGLFKFYKFYSFSTENLSDYFDKELLENKKVLLTGSSTDQIITAQLFDSNKITNYDINPLVEFMYDLKIAAIKELNIDEFINYFYYREINSNSLSNKKYEKIRNSLNGNSLDFWDTLYDLFKPITIRRKLFVCTDEPADRYIYKKFIPYLSKERYDKLKTKELLPVNFITCNILDLYKKLTYKYDLIYFSNIFSRMEMNSFFDKNYIKNLYKFMNNILNCTNDNGTIILDYLYDCSKSSFYYEERNCHHISFPIRMFKCDENILCKEIPSVNEYGQDTILIYTKKINKK